MRALALAFGLVAGLQFARLGLRLLLLAALFLGRGIGFLLLLDQERQFVDQSRQAPLVALQITGLFALRVQLVRQLRQQRGTAPLLLEQ